MIPIEVTRINEQLIREYGYFDASRSALYRIVFSDDEFEKRWVQHSKEGLELLDKIVEERPKYRQYIQGKFILEKLCAVPEGIETDLLERISYEPIWVFQDALGNAVRPIWRAVKLLIDTTQANQRTGEVKYKDPLAGLNKEELVEAKKVELKQIELELFGDTSEVADALHWQQGIVVPHNYK